MAYQIFWKIPFKSIRSGTVYTVNVYKDASVPTGYPLTLKGAAQPFVTEEDDDDDIFTAVRTQSGYLRIVDDGHAVNQMGATVTFDWKDLMPTTDTDRPVTLTHVENNTTVTDWQGFLQAQNFGGELYGNPQQRDFPVQCALATLSRMDIDVENFNGTYNFASILDYALGTIPLLTFSNIYIQGGADARAWLMKKIDWMVFGEMNEEDGIYDSKYNVLHVIESMCRYWGWTMRTIGKDIHLICVDDTSVFNFLNLTRAQLTVLAGGTSTGTIDTNGYTSQTIGNIFANTNNTDMELRGCNKATVTSEVGEINEDVIFGFPDKIMKQMYDGGFVIEPTTLVEYTNDILSFSNELMAGESNSHASFNIMRTTGSPTIPETPTYTPVIRLKDVYQDYYFAILQTSMLHMIGDATIILKGRAYKNGAEVDAQVEGAHIPLGSYRMAVQLGVGDSLDLVHSENCLWWNGESWTNTRTTFYASLGGGSDTLYTYKPNVPGTTTFRTSIPTPAGMYGYIFLLLYGSDDLGSCEIADFALSIKRPDDPWRFIDPNRHDSNTYKAKNDSMVKEEWSDDTIFSSDNYCKFGPGVVMNTDNSYFIGWNYGNHTNATSITPKEPGYPVIDLDDPTTPEQHLANRVVKFWQHSHRNIKCELRNNELPVITPHYKVTLDGDTFYPYYISNDWRDEILKLGLIEL